MVNCRGIAVFVLVVLLVGGIVGLSRTGDDSFDGFCTADGLLVEAPDGWGFVRDRVNDCEWTLFAEDGRRAPASLYEGLPIDAPPPPSLNAVRLISSSAVLVALIGLSLAWLRDRARRILNRSD